MLDFTTEIDPNLLRILAFSKSTHIFIFTLLQHSFSIQFHKKWLQTQANQAIITINSYSQLFLSNAIKSL